MISIITAVHNQLAVNRVFLDTLQKKTSTPYELIIVDNHSTDGSLEFFEQAGATIIKNPENQCSPPHTYRITSLGRLPCHHTERQHTS